jgi:hypothetical protein
MFGVRLTFIACATSLLASTVALAAPSQLYGKSIIVRWTGTQTLREAGSSSPWRSVSFTREVSVYVSSAGRVFIQQGSSNRKGSGNEQQVGRKGGSSIPSFNGRTMLVIRNNGGIVNRVVAEFDESFTACNASVIAGKSGTGPVVKTKGLITGVAMEVQSSSTSGVSCLVRTGNVFQ